MRYLRSFAAILLFSFVVTLLNKKRLPFAGLVLAGMVGILGEEILQWPSWLLMLGWIALLGGWCLLRRWRLPFCFLLVALFFGIVHAWQWEEAPARRLALLINNSNSTVLVKGVVASEVKSVGKNHVTFFIRTQQLEWDSMMLPSQVTMLVHWEGAEPRCGDLISLRAAAQSPSLAKNPGEFDKVAWLARQKIYTELSMDPSEPGTILSSGYDFFLKRWALEWRNRAEKLLESGIQDDVAVVSILKGIVLGIKEEELLLNDFKLTGTMHLFAVSGLHVGMVVMIFWFFLKLLRLSSHIAVPVTLLLLFCYVMMTGCHVGSLRAGAMAAIVLIGLLLERRPQVLNNLAAAAFLLLLFDTNLLFSMGWQFSFSVVLTIVLLAPLSERYFKKYFEQDPFLPKSLITPQQKQWQHFRKYVIQLVGVSVAAWVGALLPTAYYFHQISFSALGANILAVPLAFLIMLTALLAIGTGLMISFGAIIFNNANWLFVKILILVIHGFALLPWSSYSFALSSLHPRLTIFAFPDAQAIVLQSEGKTWMINSARAKQASRTLLPFLEQAGASHLEGLVLTACDAGEAGGASLLLEKEKPHFIFVPSNDSRAMQFHHFIKECEVLHQAIMPLPGHLDFFKKCWVEFFAPSDRPPFAFKLHCSQKSIFIIPNSNLAEWLLNTDSSEILSADVLYFAWRPMNLLQYESLLQKIKPKVLILSETFSQQESISHEEQEMLQHRGIILLNQEQVGAVMIDVLNDQTLQVSGWTGNSRKSSFQCK